jgi:hypothetical protein
MKLLPNEKTLTEATGGILTLTTHRVRYDQKASGANQVIGITLDAVSSCGVVSKSHPALLVLGLIMGGLGVGALSQKDVTNFAAGFLLGAAVLIATYFLTRSAVLAVSSAGQSIAVSAKGMKHEALVAFVDDVEQAKLKYLGKIAQ